MKTLRPVVFASLFALTTPLLAQEGHQHHGSAAAVAPGTESGRDRPRFRQQGELRKMQKDGHG
jgi:hypothetical protein